MKVNSKFILIILAVLFIFCLTACGTKEDGSDVSSSDNQDSKTISVSEDNFEWKDNIITGLTDVGAKQKFLVIPERCEGFNGSIFSIKENSVVEVKFESNKDIALNGVFRVASGIENIFLPGELSSIGDMEFWICSSLQSISIPASVLEIGAYAFQDNKALKTVVFEGSITSIKAHAFEECISLEQISFPASVSSIEEYAFYKCTSLETVKLPETISTIEGFAFANEGLSELYIPSTVQFSSYDTTSFVQAYSTVSVYVISGSWSDVNFEKMFSGSFEKKLF